MSFGGRAVLVLAFVTAACSDSGDAATPGITGTTESEIVNGVVAGAHDFPSVFVWTDSGDVSSSWSLIAPRPTAIAKRQRRASSRG